MIYLSEAQMPQSIHFSSEYIDQISTGTLQAKWSARGDRILRYYVDVNHHGLALHKEVSAPEIPILQNKVDALMAAWDAKYATHLIKKTLAQGKDLAEDMTVEAEIAREEIRQTLSNTLDVNDEVDWNSLKSHSNYVSVPFPKPMPGPVRPLTVPPVPPISLFAKITGRAKSLLSQHEQAVLAAKKAHEKKQAQKAAEVSQWEEENTKWQAEQDALQADHDANQEAANKLVEQLKINWESGEPEAVIEHAILVLEASIYPDLVPKSFDVAFDAESGTLLVDYELPDPEALPMAKTFRFVAKTGEIKETKISQKDSKELYDELGYQICLRTIHELYEADTVGNLKNVVFNGITDTVDKSIGQNVRATIMSVMAEREDFEAIDLSRVDPKACFKALKGVAASSLSGLAPIPPIMSINKDDRRFIDAQNVEVDAAGATNLAAMNWEEFEHLVRQVFEQEFASRGGEVKVTQSSSDGGVDAVAFDPDPISGGKIVIQAKRYTKTVGVSAVRDLYGTVLNEGASKGILVTTADYGPDAHKFAAGKPITLLSGSNLLHLLEKHGTKATINLKLARKELGLS